MAKGLKTTYDKMKETGKHGLIYGLTNSLTTSLAIILVPLYTRYINTEDYGLLALIVITTSVLNNIFSFGLLKSLFRFYFDNKEDKTDIARSAFSTIIPINTFMVLFVSLISPILSLLIIGKIEYFYIFILLTIEGAFLNVSNIGMSVFRAQRRSKQYSMIYIVNVSLKLTLIISFIIFFKMGIFGIIFGRLISSIIFLSVVLKHNWKYLSLRINKRLSWEMLKFGTPFIFIGISSFVLDWFDRYFINFFIGLSEVGIYNIGYQMASVVTILFFGPFNYIWTPIKFEVMNYRNRNLYYKKIFIYISFFSFFLFLLFSLLNYEPIRIIVDPSYWGSYQVIPLVTLSYIFVGITSTVNLGIHFEKKTLYSFYITIVGVVLNIILNIFFIPYYGMIGAAYTTLISYIAMFLISFIVNRRLYKIDYNWKKFNLMFIIAFIIFLIGWFFPFYDLLSSISLEKYGYPSLLITFIFKGILVISFPMIIWWSGILEKEDKEGVLRLLKDIRRSFSKKEKD